MKVRKLLEVTRYTEPIDVRSRDRVVHGVVQLLRRRLETAMAREFYQLALIQSTVIVELQLGSTVTSEPGIEILPSAAAVELASGGEGSEKWKFVFIARA